MRRGKWFWIILSLAAFGSGAAGQAQNAPAGNSPAAGSNEADYLRLRSSLIARFGHEHPTLWSETVPGVKTRLQTSEPVVALTFDACGSRSDGYDAALIDYLRRERIPATLFINARWPALYPDVFKTLAADNLFEIENHGWAHKPCSISGRMIYGIRGTVSVGDAADEIEKSARALAALTGRTPRFYRSGADYYDEWGVAIANSLHYEVVGYSVLGDAGATYSAEQVRQALLSAQPGDIVICHMNRPGSGTAAGVMAAVPELRRRGFRFVHLADYPLCGPVPPVFQTRQASKLAHKTRVKRP